jgi:hypothetical protein
MYGFGSGSFHQQAKKNKKNLDLNFFAIFNALFSLKTDVNVPTKAKEKLR